MSPWEINEFKNFLKDKQSYIKGKFSEEETLKVVDLIFEMLDVELNYELDKADKEFCERNLS